MPPAKCLDISKEATAEAEQNVANFLPGKAGNGA